MPATRRRRIVRRAVMAVAVVVLLPVWYAVAFVGCQYFAGRGIISRATLDQMNDTIFALVRISDYRDRWGLHWLSEIGTRAYFTGAGDLATEKSDEYKRQHADDVPPPIKLDVQ